MLIINNLITSMTSQANLRWVLLLFMFWDICRNDKCYGKKETSQIPTIRKPPNLISLISRSCVMYYNLANED